MKLLFYQTQIAANNLSLLCFFVCLVFMSHSRIFHSYGDVTITSERQILTYARHVWPLSKEISLVCHTYCDTGLWFMVVISEDPWHSNLLPVTSCFCRGCYSNTQPSIWGSNAITDCTTAVISLCKTIRIFRK